MSARGRIQPLMTPWGETVTPEQAWPEYPRPQLVREAWTNLNGLWQYAVRPRHAPMPERWDGEILVPFCIESPLSGVALRVTPEQRLWYRRTIALDALEPRTLLHFGAVDHHAAIWVNGAYAGSHTGGFDAFTVDVSDHLVAGDNVIVVAVDDPTSAGDQPRGKQHLKAQGIWYTPVTGIWQTVWMEQVPRANHIAEVRVATDVVAGAITVEALLARPTRDPTLAVTLTARLGERVVAHGRARPDRHVRLEIADPLLWSPDQPVLYDLDVALARVPDPTPPASARGPVAGIARAVPLHGAEEAALYAAAGPVEAELDRVRTYFGMRSVAVGPHPESRQPTLLLNGAPLFNLATLDQGWWPDGLHTPPADAAMIHEIEFLKGAGFNAVRKHIKVEPARYYYHCDRLGLLVWQDMPSGFLPAQFIAPNDEGEGIRTAASMEGFERTLTRMIRGLCGHPSVVVWVLHNEGWGQFDSARLTTWIRALDPSRPIDAASGWLDLGAGDFIDRHDYSPDPAAPAGDGRRAPVIGEYGGIGWPIQDHLWDPDIRNWGYQTLHDEAAVKASYGRVTAAILEARRSQGICAAVYTQTTDVEGEVNGLVTYDRRVEKLPREWLANVNAALRSG